MHRVETSAYHPTSCNAECPATRYAIAVPADLAKATADLFRTTIALAECPSYIIRQIQRLKPPMSRIDGTVESLIALWDITTCEELPAWVRLESDRIRRTLWRAAYVRGHALAAEVAEILNRASESKPDASSHTP